MIGKTISHYKILEKLGEGGMGVVYKARDLKLDRVVALKFLPATHVDSPEERARFQQEARALSSLNHPNIATIHDIDEVDGQRFIVLEYLSGGTLKSKIESLQSSAQFLSFTHIAEYAFQMAEGLAHAHRHEVTHRDLKTENMMLTEDGTVKITDFGLAKLRGGPHLTQSGSTLGTAGYMSPEQVRGEDLDHRSDIFSLGIIFFELTTGRLPFRGEHVAALSYSIVNENPLPIDTLRTAVPSSLASIIARCLEKEKEKRFQSAEEIVVELRNVQSPAARTTRKPLKLRWLVAAILGISLIILLYVSLPLKPAPEKEKSIAVLPFVNMSPDKEDEYFSDGMTEELINALSKIEGLHVAARTSSFVFKGKTEDISKIGQQLHVNTVLEGSVRKAGTKLRITAQLINVADGFHLWSETYEREIRDVFTIQDEISRTIVGALKVKFAGKQAAEFVKHSTENLEAYNLYLKGRYYWNRRTEDGFKKAIDYFNQAIEKDPAYALAHAGLADCYNLLSVYGLMPPKESVPKAKAAAQKALEIDNRLAEAHEALAHGIMLYDWNWSEVEREYKRAIELNPGYATAHQRYAIFLAALGNLNEAMLEIKRAQELDPLSLIITTDVGLMYFHNRQYDQAIEQCRKTLEIDSTFSVAHFTLGLVYGQMNRLNDAVTEFKKSITFSGGNPFMLAALGHAYAMSGKTREAQKILADLEKLSTQRYVPPYSRAAIYAGLGEKDQALQWLERGYEEKSVWTIHIAGWRFDPILNSLRSDPRFSALLKKIGLEK